MILQSMVHLPDYFTADRSTLSTTTLAARLNRLSGAAGAAVAAVYLLSQTSIGFLLGHKVGSQLVPMQLAFTKARFDSVVSGWTDVNLLQLQHHFYLDFVHPLWYGLMLAWALAKTLPASRHALVWIPVIAALCDVCENTLHAVPLFQGTFRELDQPYIAIGSAFAATKWMLAVVSIVLIVTFFIGKLRHK